MGDGGDEEEVEVGLLGDGEGFDSGFELFVACVL